MTRFSLADIERAHAEWSCSCGPTALAAICDLTLDEVRPHFPTFKGWTNPTMMYAALGSVQRVTGRTWVPSTMNATARSRAGKSWPSYGLARIQWEGPWTEPGGNPRWAYRHTHWVGAWTGPSEVGREVQVFDINVIGRGATQENGAGWTPLAWWSDTIAPELIADIPRATGSWHITHAIEVAR